MNRAICTFAIAALASGAPAAANSGQSAAKPTRGDPNERVCEKVEQLGTRLVAKRVCMTRAQWAEQRRGDRDLLDKSQMMACVANGANCK